jgi:DNA-binding CsgD family transcriptional regulator
VDYEKYNVLIESIYDASVDASRWRNAVIDIGNAFQSPVTGLFIQTKNQEYGGGIFEGVEQSVLERYERDFAAINPWFTTPNLMRPGHIVSDQTLDVLNGDKNYFVNHDYYQSFFKPLDLRHSMGVNLVDSQSNHLNFTFIRSARDGYYSNTEIAVFQSLSRHLMKAVELNSYIDSLERRQSVSETAFDSLRVGIIILGQTGHVEHMNTYARNLLHKDNGLFEQRSSLNASDRGSHQLLLAAMQAGFKTQVSSSVAIKRSNKSSLTATIVPSTSKRALFSFEQTSLMIFVTNPDEREVGNVEYLINRWSLTPVEAEFACHLLKGIKIAEVAERMQLTQQTAQWYSKQLLRKLDVSKQSEFIIKLMNDMALIRR